MTTYDYTTVEQAAEQYLAEKQIDVRGTALSALARNKYAEYLAEERQRGSLAPPNELEQVGYLLTCLQPWRELAKDRPCETCRYWDTVAALRVLAETPGPILSHADVLAMAGDDGVAKDLEPLDPITDADKPGVWEGDLC